jgi:hypothetical protein
MFEDSIARNVITQDQLFDNNYVPIAGTNPQQYRTQFLDFVDRTLPDIQEPLLARDSRPVFCIAIDRNGYIPVHNATYAKPQRRTIQAEISPTRAIVVSSTTGQGCPWHAWSANISCRLTPATWATASP